MRKFRTALTLAPRDLALTAEAAVLLAGFWMLVRLVPPRHWRGWAARPAAAATSESDTPRRVRRAVLRALRNMPMAPNCLPQALAARTMLHRRGVACALHLGATRSEDGEPRFHAWTVAEGLWVTGECDERRFARFPASLQSDPAPPCEAPARLASRTAK